MAIPSNSPRTSARQSDGEACKISSQGVENISDINVYKGAAVKWATSAASSLAAPVVRFFHALDTRLLLIDLP